MVGKPLSQEILKLRPESQVSHKKSEGNGNDIYKPLN